MQDGLTPTTENGETLEAHNAECLNKAGKLSQELNRHVQLREDFHGRVCVEPVYKKNRIIGLDWMVAGKIRY